MDSGSGSDLGRVTYPPLPRALHAVGRLSGVLAGVGARRSPRSSSAGVYAPLPRSGPLQRRSTPRRPGAPWAACWARPSGRSCATAAASLSRRARCDPSGPWPPAPRAHRAVAAQVTRRRTPPRARSRCRRRACCPGARPPRRGRRWPTSRARRSRQAAPPRAPRPRPARRSLRSRWPVPLPPHRRPHPQRRGSHPHPRCNTWARRLPSMPPRALGRPAGASRSLAPPSCRSPLPSRPRRVRSYHRSRGSPHRPRLLLSLPLRGARLLRPAARARRPARSAAPR